MRVEVQHEWSKERVTLDVDAIISVTRIIVRWPLQGAYEVNLSSNTMRALSAKARGKSPYCLWRLVNVEAVKEEVKQALKLKTPNEVLQRLMTRHWETMPKGKG